MFDGFSDLGNAFKPFADFGGGFFNKLMNRFDRAQETAMGMFENLGGILKNLSNPIMMVGIIVCIIVIVPKIMESKKP